MPQLTYINTQTFDVVVKPLQSLTYCLIGALIISAVWFGPLTVDNPAHMSGELVGSELSFSSHKLS